MDIRTYDILKSIAAKDAKTNRLLQYSEVTGIDLFGDSGRSGGEKITTHQSKMSDTDIKYDQKADIFWGGILAAIATTRSSENMLKDVQTEFVKMKNKITNIIANAKKQNIDEDPTVTIWEPKDENNPDGEWKKIPAGKLDGFEQNSPRKYRRLIINFIEYVRRIAADEVDRIGKFSTDEFYNFFADRTLGSDAQQILTLKQAFDINLTDEKVIERFENFLEQFGKNTRWSNAANKLHEILLKVKNALEQQIEGGSVDALIDELQKIASGPDYKTLVKAAYNTLVTSTAAKVIEEQLTKVQNELGARVSGNVVSGAIMKGTDKDKKNNQAIQNVIGNFTTYVFVMAAVGAAAYEAKTTETTAESLMYRIMQSHINEIYFEGIKAFAGKLMYKFGKRYTSFSQAVSNEMEFTNIISILLRNRGILSKAVSYLVSQGLITDEMINDIVSKKIFENKIRVGSVAEVQKNPVLKSVIMNLSKPANVYNVIKQIYSDVGIKQSAGAALGTKLRGMADALANKTPQQGQSPEQQGQSPEQQGQSPKQ
ncbi:MAG TPA: hypothetical protein PK705_07430 [Clostridia bacterium]|nr:hypothetical protein [Clostridia bacterium]